MAKINLFGFTIGREEKANSSSQSFAVPNPEDGAITISGAAAYGTYLDLDGTAKNDVELISRYREMAMQPEIESAIDDIVNETIVVDDDGKSVKIVMDDLDQPDKIKELIKKEFQTVLKLLSYKSMAQDIFRRYYVDGRLLYHIMVDKENPQFGIQELRYIDPRKIRKVREIKKIKDERTGADVVETVNEYYLFNDKVISSSSSNYGPIGVRIAPDSIVQVVSGLMDARRSVILSYLHKAIKPLNQLRMIEDATVIYRISRAPERRIFYVDVGDLPKLKAEQYLRDIMVKYKNKLTYDASTGEVRDDRKYLSIMEDFWMPRRGGKSTTEIDTLPGGQNLGELEDVKYFEKKLYKSLNVPISRLDPNQSGFSLGRVSEITRDEVKFSKFIDKIRRKFSEVFYQALRVQCVLKGICTDQEFNDFKEHIYFDFIKDNNFAELKEAELVRDRLALLQEIDNYTGRYFSEKWIKRNVLRLTDDEIKDMDKEINTERENGIVYPSDLMMQQQNAQLDNTQAQTDNMAVQAYQTSQEKPEAKTPKKDTKK